MDITKERGLLYRAVAIVMIVAYHFQYDVFGGTFLMRRGEGIGSWFSRAYEYIQQEPVAVLGLMMMFCFVGVNVFFVLSGYSLAKKHRDDKSVKLKSIFGQTMKVLIPFWLAHPIIHVVDWILKNAQYQVGLISYETYFSGMHGLSQYFESMLVVPRWFSNEGALLFVGTWWFVGVIIQFYLLFPVLFYFFKRYKASYVFLACLVISLGYRYGVSVLTSSAPIGMNEANILLFTNFPARLSEFALGVYLAFDQRALKSVFKLPMGGISLLLGYLALGNVYTMFVSDFLFAIGAMALVGALIPFLEKYLGRLTAYIGKKSYLIYLYHEPTMKLVLKFILPNWIR